MKKGDLVYIPADSKLVAFESSSRASKKADQQYCRMKNLKVPSLAIVCDYEPYQGQRKIYITNEGYWWVEIRNIRIPWRTENDRVTRSSST